MRNLKITIKSAVGSLATRALVVSLCLLVLPLFLHTLYLYRSDYEDNVNEAASYLRLTARAQKEILDDKIEREWSLLDAAISENSLLSSPHFEMIETEVPSSLQDYFVLVDQKTNAFWVGKILHANLAWVIATPLSILFRDLTDFEEKTFPTSLAILDAKGNLLAGAKQETPFHVQLPIEGGSLSLYLSIPLGAIQDLDKKVYFLHFVSLFFFIALIGGFLVALITKRMAKPLHTLCETMRKVSEGAVHARYHPDPMGFEINALGKEFNETLDRLLHHQQEAEKERIGREKLAQELKIGHEIQIKLLPTQLPQFPGIEIAAEFVSAKEVGGDFYDLFPITETKFLIAIGDTAGKGISACLFSLGLRSILRSMAVSKSSLSEIIQETNNLFLQDAEPSDMFVTLWAGIYDTKTNLLEFSNAGHLPSLLIHEGKIEELTTQGMAMGIQRLETVEVKTKKIEPKALLFLYTDGVIEAHNSENLLFGAGRLEEILVQNSDAKVDILGKTILEGILAFSKKTFQHDDITFVTFKRSHL